MTIWSFIVVVVVVFISTYGLVSGQGTVNLQPPSNSTVCGNTATFSCQTSGLGLLEWRDANGTTFRFTSSADDPGATGSLGEFSLLLTEESGTTLSSTATIDRVTSDILLFCFNGALTGTDTVNLAGRISAPLNFKHDPIRRLLTWDPADDTPNCCVNYTLEMVDVSGDTMSISVGPVFEYNISHITVNTTFRLYCEDLLGRESASSLTSVTFPPSPPPTCSPPPPCPPVWVWIVIGILAVSLVIAIPFCVVGILKTAKYIYERCCKPIDDVSMKGSSHEMK